MWVVAERKAPLPLNALAQKMWWAKSHTLISHVGGVLLTRRLLASGPLILCYTVTPGTARRRATVYCLRHGDKRERPTLSSAPFQRHATVTTFHLVLTPFAIGGEHLMD